ncbi:hypothetical protein Poli38472_001524 [Pythium oligandrum]|uniref:Ribonuclease P/MRP protein subunit POP5 n=1 Tax=Pythium oligandrum TaxID=41045 RepID=A0A8K1CW71_PYTOL|nr:hypothetical protein Poli38472_001524 [Pythium oligandrum]|eukprot:TMW69368.1 hypothetical protein Poli38472_001524 [Pythium oligandrum]
MVRLKTRYLIVEVNAPPQARKLSLQKEDVTSIIKESIARSYGDYGVGLLQYAFQVLYANKTTGFIAIRCSRDYVKMVEASLVFVTEHQGQELRFRIVRVCGVGRTCRQNLLEMSRDRLKKLQVDSITDEELQKEINEIDPQ